MAEPCTHTPETCPDDCDGPRATWRPVVGQVFKGHTIDHGPGAKFTPDGSGGGSLAFMVMERRPGFRAGPRLKTIRKHALGAS